MSISWLELKELREYKGWTQADLAKAIGVHPKTIVNWESTDVPPRSEYKVTRVLGDELSYLDGIRGGHLSPDTTFEEWREMLRRDRDHSEEVREREYDAGIDLDERDEQSAILSEDALAKAQASYEERLSVINGLSRFSRMQLLLELVRRERVENVSVSSSDAGASVASVGGNVSGLSDDDLHSMDLSQQDHALAASHDDTTVTEQQHPNYEDESQATED